MLNIQELKELIKQIDETSISLFELKQGNEKLTIQKGTSSTVSSVTSAPTQQALPSPPIAHQTTTEAPAAPEAPEATPTAPVLAPLFENLHQITSPMVGTFYDAPSPNDEPFVAVGAKVDARTPVCIVEAMKLFNEIEAEVSGEIVEVLVKSGQLVEYGQPLFLVRPL